MSTLVHSSPDDVSVLRHPVGIAVDETTGRVIVGDSYHHCVRAVDKVSGAVTKLAGWVGEEGFLDGPGDLARFFHPYVALTGQCAVAIEGGERCCAGFWC